MNVRNGQVTQRPKNVAKRTISADDDMPHPLEVEIAESLQDLLNWSHHKKTLPLGAKKLPSLDDYEDMSKEKKYPMCTKDVSQLIDIVHARDNHTRANKKTKQSFNKVKFSNDKSPRLILPKNFTNDTIQGQSAGDLAHQFRNAFYNTQQVYTTPNHTQDIRKKFPCLLKSRSSSVAEDHEKPGTACMCQHCGIVGVLIESQKRPAIPHTPNPKFSGNSHNLGVRKLVQPPAKSKSEMNLHLLKELINKVNTLEDRLSIQEESTVQKDYFKFVIHRLITQYSAKINELKVAMAYQTKPSNNMSTQYSTRPSTPKERQKRKSKDQYGQRDTHRIYPVKVNTMVQHSGTEHEQRFKQIPKPNEVKTVLMANDTRPSPFPHEVEKEANKASGHAIRKLCDMVYHKYRLKSSYVRGNEENEIPAELLKRTNGEMKHPSRGHRNRTVTSAQPLAKRMNVAYVNPALKTWHDESEQEFAVVGANNSILRQEKCYRPPMNCSPNATSAAAKNKLHGKHSIEEKITYLRYLAKRKKVSESDLWNNILTQAQRNIRSKEDTVSIQLPHLPHGPELSELELTVTKLTEMAQKCHSVKKIPSKFTMDKENRNAFEKFAQGAKARRKLNLNKMK